MHSKLYIPARSATLPLTVDVTPETAGWTESSLQVIELDDTQSAEFGTGDTEAMILPLFGVGSVECAGESFALAPRGSVFDGPGDMVYIGIDNTYTLSGEGRFAICGARAKRSFPNRRVAAADVAVELRGAGSCSRQVHNFGTADAFEADSLIACEVITPGGNWSSYPPHKHDDASNGVEAELEEIYYFRVEGPHGMAAHRTYDLTEGWDVTVTIGDGDVFLVPRGFHGPCMASPDHALWYLNVLAGPGEVRSMAISDDPAHAWIRAAWAGETGDPRVPMVTAQGRRS